jgi:hypothetical protein
MGWAQTALSAIQNLEFNIQNFPAVSVPIKTHHT